MSLPLKLTVPLLGRRRPDKTSSRLVLPAPLGPMIPKTSPASTLSEIALRMLRPPRSRAMSVHANSGGASGGARTVSPPGGSVKRAFGQRGRIDDLVLAALHLEIELRHALLEVGRGDVVAVIGIVRAFLEGVVHAHIAADAAIRMSAYPVVHSSEFGGIADAFPGSLEIVGHVITVAGVAKAHDAGETLLVFGAKLVALFVGVDAEHRAPHETFRGGAGELQKFRLRWTILQIDPHPPHKIDAVLLNDTSIFRG